MNRNCNDLDDENDNYEPKEQQGFIPLNTPSSHYDKDNKNINSYINITNNDNDNISIISSNSCQTPPIPDSVSNSSSLLSNLDTNEARIVYLNDPIKNSQHNSTTNIIITSKYTKFNFIPKFLFERFSQIANFYFLLVGAGQTIPYISSTSNMPLQWFVLFIVLAVDSIFAIIEDYSRHKSDHKMNNIVTRRFDIYNENYRQRDSISKFSLTLSNNNKNDDSNPDIDNVINMENSNDVFNKIFKPICWKDVQVGDILCIYNHESVPADVLILAVHESDYNSPTGICFIETKSLDGETNLKIRQALSCTYSQLYDPLKLSRLPGYCVYEQPNSDINNFSGRFIPEIGEAVPLDIKNLVLRGTIIRNTPYIYGLVLNTGRDTKIMQSLSKTHIKRKVSNIMFIVNKGISVLMILLILLCCIGSIVCTTWIQNNKYSVYYLYLNAVSGIASFRVGIEGGFLYFGYYWILIASFVPITLYVSIAIVKGYQSYFINRDLQMYHEQTDTPALVRDSELNDDLGQITHIFSDKTGTLTANIMDFRKMSINGISYGRGTTEIGRASQLRTGRRLSERDLLADSIVQEAKLHGINSGIPNVNFIDPLKEFIKDYNGDGELGNIQSERIERFIKHLALCHTVVIEKQNGTSDNSDISSLVLNDIDKNINQPVLSYSASSPDELALVSGAYYFGFKFCDRMHGSVTIELPSGMKETYELLEIIEFTSARKRMSVVVRSPFPENKIIILSKGADNIMFSRLKQSEDNGAYTTIEDIKQKTISHLERYAEEGLRTLVLCGKVIDEDYFINWSRRYKQALSDLNETKKYKKGQISKLDELEDELENDLELYGATGIEDRLQEAVPSTIRDLRKAGIKIWILTGDKEETAINIGYACQMLDNDTEKIIINNDSCKTFEDIQNMFVGQSKQIEFYKRKSEQNTSLTLGSADNLNAYGMIIDGDCLRIILSSELLCSLFVEISQECSSVICCRVSPSQKALVVRLYMMYSNGIRTLAIGDGANDVGMIKEAHVGVGISGNEGMQAVNSSDFAIAQFSYLKRLLLVHGHWNYHRISKLVLYIVYKNIMVYFALFVLSMVPVGSGTLYYNNMWLNGFNVFWTSFPCCVLAVLDQETSSKLAEDFPALYSYGIIGYLFSFKIFLQWICEAIYEATICAVLPVYLLGFVDSDGYSHSLQNIGGISWCAMITVSWIKLGLNTVIWNYLVHVTVWGSVIFWYFSGIIISLYFGPLISDNVFPYILLLPEFYLIVILCVICCLYRDLVYKTYVRECIPAMYHVLQEIDAYKTLLKIKKKNCFPLHLMSGYPSLGLLHNYLQKSMIL